MALTALSRFNFTQTIINKNTTIPESNMEKSDQQQTAN